MWCNCATRASVDTTLHSPSPPPLASQEMTEEDEKDLIEELKKVTHILSPPLSTPLPFTCTAFIPKGRVGEAIANPCPQERFFQSAGPNSWRCSAATNTCNGDPVSDHGKLATTATTRR